MAVGSFAVILLLLLIFILQNGTQVSVSYLGHARPPSARRGPAARRGLRCALVVLAGTARIGQLRTTARRHRRVDAKRAAAAAKEPANP